MITIHWRDIACFFGFHKWGDWIHLPTTSLKKVVSIRHCKHCGLQED